MSEKSSTPEKQIIKVGVIGTGGISRNHLFSLTLIEANRKIWGKNKRVKLWAMCDKDQSKIDEKKQLFPAKKYYNDAYDLINDEEIDAVYVLTPTKYHKEYVIAAANKGKHVFCEKPLAITPEDIDEMVEARDKNNVKIQAGLVMRSAPIIEYLKNYLKTNAKKLGKPLNLAFRDSQWKPYVGEKEAHAGSTWRKNKNLAHGGILFEHIIHDIDAMSYIFGYPEEVYCKVKYNAGYEGIEDSVSAMIDFPNNFQMDITANWHNIHHDQRRLEIYFENAFIWITVDDSVKATIKYLGEDEQQLDLEECEKYYRDLIKMPHLKTEIPGPYYYESVNFFSSIFTDTPCYPTLEIGKSAQIVIDRCYESAKAKKPLKI